MKNFLKQISSLILPLTVLIIVPLAIEDTWETSENVFMLIGFLFIAGGLVLLSWTISLFIRIGKGTLAPWSPTTTLVRIGVYAYTRNPMISGVLLILLGESLTFHSGAILTWAVAFFAITHTYFVLFEEPGLAKRFGREYVEYKNNVPRWIPRVPPWEQ